MLIKSLKKSLVISGLTALLGMPGAQASDCNNCNDWNPCSFEYGLNPPPVRPNCSGCTWYGDLEYLYWKPFVDNAHAADIFVADNIQTFPIPDETNSNLSTHSKDFKYDWDSGFRVAIGYGFPCDRWGMSLTWTHYRTDAGFDDSGFGTSDEVGNINNNVKMPLPGFANGYFTGQLIGAQDGHLVSNWNFQLNQLDLDFFRDYYVGCSVSIKPYVGLRALFLKQTINSFADYTFTGNQSYFYTIDRLSIAQTLRSDFKSFGLKAGLESFWEVMCGLGIYGNFGASLLYSHFRTDHQLQMRALADSGDPTFRTNSEIPYDFHSLKMTSDLAIGIEWRRPINCNQNLVVLKAGWEHHLIINGSQFRTLDRDLSVVTNDIFPAAPRGTSTNGDISLYGFVVSVAVSF